MAQYIDPKKAHFFVRRNSFNGFDLIVAYNGFSYVALSGALAYVKGQFIRVVKNRSLLTPFLMKKVQQNEQG